MEYHPFLETFLSQSTDAFAEFDQDGRYVFINSATSELLGYPLAIFIGQTPANLLGSIPTARPSSDSISCDAQLHWALQQVMSQIASAVNQVLTSAEPLRTLHSITQPGETCLYDTLYTPIRDANGAVVRVFSMGRKVTTSSAPQTDLKASSTPEFEPNLPQDDPRFKSLVLSIPGAIYRCACDDAWTMEFISQAIAAISGYPASDFIQNQVRSYSSIIHPDDLETVSAAVLQGVTAHQPYAIEYRIIASDGSIRWVYERGQGSYLGQKLAWLDGAIFDITDQKQTELALAEQTAILQLVMDSVPEAIFWKDTNLVYLGCNRKWADLIGMANPADILGKTDYDLPWAETDATYLQDCDRHVITTNQADLHTLIAQTLPNGQTLWLDTNRVPIRNANGHVIGLLGTFENVSDRKKAEDLNRSAALLQLVLDNIPQYIFWKDRQSVYMGCNRRWAEMAGIGEPENAIGLTDYDLPWTPIEAQFYLECDRRVMESGQPELRIVESQRQADGKQTWRETNKIPIHDANGNVIGILGTLEDITERKRAEELLQQSEARFREMAQREALLNHLASQIRNSLDINTILSTTVNEIRRLLAIDRCDFIWYRPDTTPPHLDWVCESCSPDLPSQIGQHSLETTDNIYHQALTRLIPIQLDDVRISPLIDFPMRAYLTHQGYVSYLASPLKTRSGKLGLLVCGHCRTVRPWAPPEVDLIQAIATQLAIALDQADLYDQSRTTAIQAEARAHQLKQALEDLQQTQAQLIQTEKMSSLGQLVAGIAHEINNPVNFIYGNLTHINEYSQNLIRMLRLYEKHYPTPHTEIQDEIDAIDLSFIVSDLPQILTSLKVGADRIRQIILSLRNFSRLDEAEKKPVNIHEGLDSTLLILQSRIKPKPGSPGIHIIKHYGALPLVECYAGQLNQVFMNILSNAIDALDESTQRSSEKQQDADHVTTASCLTIASQALESWIATPSPLPSQNPTWPFTAPVPVIQIQTEVVQSRRVLIRIFDNGPGMSERVRQRLFDPFFTTKPVGKGTGLGLSISYQIVTEKHGGTLRCNSAPGVGAEFLIDIPIL